MVEDAVLTMLLSHIGGRWVQPGYDGRGTSHRARGVLARAAGEPAGSSSSERCWGTLSPTARKPARSLRWSRRCFPGGAAPARPCGVFGWLQRLAFLPAAVERAPQGPRWVGAAPGMDEAPLIAGCSRLRRGCVPLTLLYAHSCAIERSRTTRGPRVSLGRLGLGRSRRAVLQLARLQAVGRLRWRLHHASLLAYWFHVRSGGTMSALGRCFLGPACSRRCPCLVATRVAERIRPAEIRWSSRTYRPTCCSWPCVHAVVRRRGCGSPGAHVLVADGRRPLAGLHHGPVGRGEAGRGRPDRRAPRPGASLRPVVSGLTMAAAATPCRFSWLRAQDRPTT